MAAPNPISPTRNEIAEYATKQTPEFAAICAILQKEIDAALPNATSRIWHGGPVWFLGENPVAGYDARPKAVELLFWSGQLFDEPMLKPLGKDKAAKASFKLASEIDAEALRRWLSKSATIVVDYVAMYAAKRAAAAKQRPKR